MFFLDIKSIGTSAKTVTSRARRCEGSLVDVISVIPDYVKDSDENVQVNVAKIKSAFLENDKKISECAARKREAASDGKRQRRNFREDIERMSVKPQPVISLTAQKYNDPQSIEKKESLKYVPSHLPPFPYAHTYNATPVKTILFLSSQLCCCCCCYCKHTNINTETYIATQKSCDILVIFL